MIVKERNRIFDTVKQFTISFSEYERDILGIYRFITDSIEKERERIENLQEIDTIIVESLEEDCDRLSDNIIVLNQERKIVRVFVCGDFTEDSEITLTLSEILADFYVEYLLLPILNNVSYQYFETRQDYFIEQMRNGVRVYEAKGRIS
ncbi:MAG: hypothetical protein J7647_07270 [Cyanobacteria bacterium SBLK]|nr:hypothetical protein [Cyanobacteria bacterium SBLK]